MESGTPSRAGSSLRANLFIRRQNDWAWCSILTAEEEPDAEVMTNLSNGFIPKPPLSPAKYCSQEVEEAIIIQQWLRSLQQIQVDSVPRGQQELIGWRPNAVETLRSLKAQ